MRLDSSRGSRRDLSRLLLPTAVVALTSVAVVVACSAAAWRDFGGLGYAVFEERAAFMLLASPYAGVVVGPILAGTAFAVRRIRGSAAGALATAPWLAATLLFLCMIVLLGPVAGFHHMFRFGLLGYGILDCESQSDLGHCETRGSLMLLLVSAAAWLCVALGLHRLCGRPPAT